MLGYEFAKRTKEKTVSCYPAAIKNSGGMWADEGLIPSINCSVEMGLVRYCPEAWLYHSRTSSSIDSELGQTD